MSSYEPHVVRSERRARQRAAPAVQDAAPADTAPARVSPTPADDGVLKRSAYDSSARLRKVAPRYYLGYLSTSALTLNRMIGTGIFVVPPVVLSITGSKTMSFLLWLIGGLMTWAGMTVYLEYGIRWPLTGGELHYIDRVWTRPRKLLTYIYAVVFVILGGGHPNALVFGAAVLAAATPDGTPIDRRLQKLFAILIMAVVCLFQSFSRLNYIRFSDIFALYKVCLLTVITILGWVALAGTRSASAAASAAEAGGSYGTTNLRNDISGGTYSAYGTAVALLAIMRVYSGYENVNYVLEEVQRPPKDPNRIFRRSMKMTSLFVTFFYIMVNVAYFAACDTRELTTAPDPLSLFFSKVFGPSPSARVASGVLLCLSATGNIMSATYTDVRVKQEIARMGILPVSQFWARSSRYDTPGPALFLHWIFTTIFIIACPLGDPNGYLVISTLFSYSRTVIEVALGLALLAAPWLSSFRHGVGERWTPQGSRIFGMWLIYPLSALFVCSNLFVFIVSWFPSDFQDSLSLVSPITSNYVGPVITISIYGLAVLYWLWDLAILPGLGYEVEVREPEVVGEDDTLEVVITFRRKIDGFAKRVWDSVKPILKFFGRVWDIWFRNRYIAEEDS